MLKLIAVIGTGLVVLIIIVVVIDQNTCVEDIACVRVACTPAAPCAVLVNDAPMTCIAGNACGNLGSVCESHWFSADCTCQNASPTPGVCSVVCAKP